MSFEAHLLHWLQTAEPWTEYVYYRGNLMRAREDENLLVREEAGAVAEMFYEAYRRREVLLFQRRTGPGMCDYCAVKLPGSVPAAFAELFGV